MPDEVGDTMEIGTYLRVLGWRAAAAAIVVGGAIAAPVGVVLRQPPEFTAVAAVRVPALATEPGLGAGGDEEGSQLAADLDAVLRQPATRRSLAAETDVPPGALAAKLTVTRAGSQQYVDITYRDTSKARARRVAQLAALKSLTILYEERLLVARFTLRIAEDRLAFVSPASAAGSSPVAAYQRARGDQARLEELAAERSALGDAAGARSALDRLDAVRADAAAAAAELVRSRQAAAEGAAAHQAVEQARRQLIPAEERARAITEGPTVSDGPVRRARPVKRLAEVGIAGAVVAASLVFGYLTLAEVRSALRRRSARAG